MKLSRNLPALAVVIFLACTTFCPAAPKEEPLSVNPPPMAQAQSVSLYRGKNIEIPLRAVGRIPTHTRFIVRDKPSRGRLGEIRVTGRDTAVVTYTHDDKAGPGTDSFSYAVQALDSPVSARALVQITISEPAPILSAPLRQEFGQVFIGKTREEEITLKNAGGGLLAGTISVTAPWQIIGPTNYSLHRNEEKTIRLQFAPREEREYAGRLEFSHDGRVVIGLGGDAIAPLVFEPRREVEFQNTGSTGRTGKLLVTNRSDNERTITITTPPEIAAAKEIQLSPGEQTLVDLQARLEDSKAAEGDLVIESEGYRREIPFRVFSIASLVSAEPNGFSFGDMSEGSTREATLTLKNSGGLEARITADLPKEITMTPGAESMILAPGASQAFQIVFKPLDPGDYAATIQLETGSPKPLTLAVSAKVNPSPDRKPIFSAPSVSASGTSPETESMAPDKNPDPLAFPGLRIVQASARDVEIAWDKPADQPERRYVVELRSLERAKEGPPKFRWTEFRNIRIAPSADGKSISARFSHLPPSRSWNIRLTGIDAGGNRISSPTLSLTTPKAAPNRLREFFLIVLVIGVVAGGVWQYRRNRKKKNLEDAKRLDRLEHP